jgi:hypothetical protein
LVIGPSSTDQPPGSAPYFALSPLLSSWGLPSKCVITLSTDASSAFGGLYSKKKRTSAALVTTASLSAAAPLRALLRALLLLLLRVEDGVLAVTAAARLICRCHSSSSWSSLAESEYTW